MLWEGDAISLTETTDIRCALNIFLCSLHFVFTLRTLRNSAERHPGWTKRPHPSEQNEENWRTDFGKRSLSFVLNPFPPSKPWSATLAHNSLILKRGRKFSCTQNKSRYICFQILDNLSYPNRNVVSIWKSTYLTDLRPHMANFH